MANKKNPDRINKELMIRVRVTKCIRRRAGAICTDFQSHSAAL